MEQPAGNSSNFIDRVFERLFVRFRRLGEAADFSHKLKRCRTNFVGRNWRIEVKKSLDIPAHKNFPSGKYHTSGCGALLGVYCKSQEDVSIHRVGVAGIDVNHPTDYGWPGSVH